MKLLPIGLLLSAALWGCAGVTQNTSMSGSGMSDAPQAKQIMCMWLAHGKRQYICSQGTNESAQTQCDAEASRMRGDDSVCTCNGDPNYIRDYCGSDPKVTSGWHRVR